MTEQLTCQCENAECPCHGAGERCTNPAERGFRYVELLGNTCCTDCTNEYFHLGYGSMAGGHTFTTGRLTGATTCDRCGLMPLGVEDVQSACFDIDADEALEGYLECWLWVGQFWPTGEGVPTPLDDIAFGFTSEAEESARADLMSFIELCDEAGLSYPADSSQFGHDLYLTREGHGVGYWDRGLVDGQRLSELAHSMGEAPMVERVIDGLASL